MNTYRWLKQFLQQGMCSYFSPSTFVSSLSFASAETMLELERLFPGEVAADGSRAKISKSKVVRTPQSVYKAVAGCEAIRYTF